MLCPQIGRYRQVVIGSRRRLEPTPLGAAEPKLVAPLFDAAHADGVAICLQFLVQPLRPVAAPCAREPP